MTELVLHEACAIGDYETLEEYIKTGKYDPNCRDEEWSGKGPLHWACIRGNTLESLTNWSRGNMISFIIIFLLLGSIECTRLLLSLGVSGNIRMDYGWTPAHCAAESGRIHILRALHSANVRLDETCYYGDTPLAIAARYNHSECCRFLERQVSYSLYRHAVNENHIHVWEWELTLFCSVYTEYKINDSKDPSWTQPLKPYSWEVADNFRLQFSCTLVH